MARSAARWGFTVAGLVAAGLGCWWWLGGTDPHRRLEQARAAFARGDRHQGEHLAALLENQGAVDLANLARGEASLRMAREWVAQSKVARALETAEAHVRLLTAIAPANPTLASPLDRAARCHSVELIPLSSPTPLREKRLQLERQAAAAFTRAAGLCSQTEGRPMSPDAVLAWSEALLGLHELGKNVPLAPVEHRLRELAEASPDNLPAHRLLAAIYLDLNSLDLAMRELEAVARLDPEDGRPQRMIGLLFKNTLKTGRAVEAYEEALRRNLEPHVRAEVCEELAQLRLELGQGEEALRVLKACPEPHSRSVHHRVLRAEALWISRPSPEARSLLQEALREDPNAVAALRLLGRMHLDDLQPEQAIPHLEKALAISPADHQCRHLLAEAYELTGRSKEAACQREQREKIQALKAELTRLHGEASARPWDEGVRLRMAELWIQMRGHAEARTWLRAVLTINPENQAARKLLRELETGRSP